MTIYDQFLDIETPELSPTAETTSTTKPHSYFTVTRQAHTRHEDSDFSSSSMNSPCSDIESPFWWDASLENQHHNNLHRYKEFLREKIDGTAQFRTPLTRTSGRMTKSRGKKNTSFLDESCIKEVAHLTDYSCATVTKPCQRNNNNKTFLPTRPKQQENHTHIVEVMQESHDLPGDKEFCFWSMNGCPCQCGKCN